MHQFLKNSVGGKKNKKSNSQKAGFFLSSALQIFFKLTYFEDHS